MTSTGADAAHDPDDAPAPLEPPATTPSLEGTLEAQAQTPARHTLEDTPAREALPGGVRAALARTRASGSWRTPAVLFLGALVLYSLFAFERLKGPSPDTHFVYLANTYNAMIASRFDEGVARRRADRAWFELDRAPPHRNDWASYLEVRLRPGGELVRGNWVGHGEARRFKLLNKQEMKLTPRDYDAASARRRYFVSFPPGPAWVMMPLAAVWGYRVNDVWLTLLFAAANVALMFIMLERLAAGGRTGRSRQENLWLTALFALSTAHLWCAVLGQVWFTALIMGITWTLLYMIWGMDARRPFLAGCALALGFATRTPLLFTAPFFFAFVLCPGGRWLRREEWAWAIKKLAWFCAPCLAVGIGLLVMNKLRFDSWTAFGHALLAEGQLARIQQYGLFHPVFLSKNLTALLTLLPRPTLQPPYLLLSRHGMSILLTTPAFAYLLWPRPRQTREDRFWYRALWLTVACCALPGLFYQNTGYEQFGFRFSLDYTAYLIALLAVGRHPITQAFKACVVFGALVNAFGAVTFKRFHQLYRHDLFV